MQKGLIHFLGFRIVNQADLYENILQFARFPFTVIARQCDYNGPQLTLRASDFIGWLPPILSGRERSFYWHKSARQQTTSVKILF